MFDRVECARTKSAPQMTLSMCLSSSQLMMEGVRRSWAQNREMQLLSHGDGGGDGAFPGTSPAAAKIAGCHGARAGVAAPPEGLCEARRGDARARRGHLGVPVAELAILPLPP